MNSRDVIDDTVATWASERPDLDFDAMRLFLMIGSLVRNVGDRTRPLVEELGITLGEFDVLATLRRSGKNALLTPSYIAEVAMVSPSGLTHRLTQLEKAELITRELDTDDRRSFKIRITSKGIKIADKAIAMMVDEPRQIFDALSLSDQRALRTMLETLLDSSELTIEDLGAAHADTAR